MEKEKRELLRSWAIAEEKLIGDIQSSDQTVVVDEASMSRPVSSNNKVFVPGQSGIQNKITSEDPPLIIQNFDIAPIHFLLTYFGVLRVQVSKMILLTTYLKS